MDLIKYGYNGRLLTVLQDRQGNPWWVAREVCDVLGLENVSKAVSVLDNDEKNTITISDGIPGNPNKLVINEPGLYSLIFKSRKTEARTFKRWVTHEVLPDIRKIGSYTHAAEKKRKNDSRLFKTMTDVLAYVRSSGLNIQKSKIYNDVRKGIIRRNENGSVSIEEVELYIRKHKESGLPKYSGYNSEIDHHYSQISKQQRIINNILSTSFKIAKLLGHSKEKASLIAQQKVEELTGIRLSDVYQLPLKRPPGKSVVQNREETIDDDLIEHFIDECCEIGNEFKSPLNILYPVFCSWLVSLTGNNPPSRNKFSEYLSAFVDRTQHAGTIFHGIKISAKVAAKL